MSGESDGNHEFFFNGINGATGNYGLPPLQSIEVAKIAAGETFTEEELYDLQRKWDAQKYETFGVKEGIDPQNISEAGWGVIFAPDVTDAVKEALAPLLELRKEQAGKLYQNFPDEKAFRPDDTKNSFLGRSKAGPGTVDPSKVPYYLLIVGDPKSIPYRFQYQLDVQYAVGRIHFDDPDQYATYAASVKKAEEQKAPQKRGAAFVGVRNPDDRPTALSADNLVKPLFDKLKEQEKNWDWRCALGEDATKAKVTDVLGGSETPSLLFTASHGMEFPLGDPRQIPHQGALLCQNWPGPFKHRGRIPEDFYFAGTDIAADANVDGLIAFFFACYGAGTPKTDDFSHKLPGAPKDIASFPFVASLPKKLLGHPKGGALAVIAHVERAWSCSFIWRRSGEQLATFESSIKKLLNGKRVGFAMEDFNVRYAELSTDLTAELEDRKARSQPRPPLAALAEDDSLAGMWTANNDARSYVVLGDPAVSFA